MIKAFFVLTILVSTATAVFGFECNVCHSKNPAMVRMHQAVKGQGCFGCHKVGDRLMGKGKPKDRDGQFKRRLTDENCAGCHGSGTAR